jgi:hypothetical protein
MRSTITSLVELASATAITVGAVLVWAPLGWITGGALGLAFARGLAR